MTYSEASAVTDIGTAFKNSGIVTFEELRFFNLQSETLSEAFYGCSSLKRVIVPKCTKVDMHSFYNCTSMEYLRFDGFDAASHSDMYSTDNHVSTVYLSADCKGFKTKALRLGWCKTLIFEHTQAPFNNTDVFGSDGSGWIGRKVSGKICYIPANSTGYDTEAWVKLQELGFAISATL